MFVIVYAAMGDCKAFSSNTVPVILDRQISEDCVQKMIKHGLPVSDRFFLQDSVVAYNRLLIAILTMTVHSFYSGFIQAFVQPSFIQFAADLKLLLPRVQTNVMVYLVLVHLKQRMSI